jgi:hypothetical protein
MLSVLFFISSTVLPGLAVASFLKTRAWFLAYGLGTALISFELFLYFVILRLPFSAFLFWFFGAQTILAVVLLIIRLPWRKQVIIRIGEIKPLAWLLGIIIAVMLFLSLIQALGKPPVAFDSVAFWAMRAKVLIADGRVNFNPESPNYLSALTHHNYPWHLSFMEYWFRQLGAQAGTVNLIAWFYFLSLILVLGDFLIRRLGSVKGLLLVLFFASQPFIFYHASNNYADLVIGFYAAAAFSLFFKLLDTKNISPLLIAAALFAWTLCVKNYGIFYIIAFGLGFALAYLWRTPRLSVKSTVYTALAFALPILPFALFKIVYRLNLHNSDAAWVWHPEIIYSLGQSLFISNNWNIWWVIFVVMALFCFKNIRRTKELWIAWLMFAMVILIIVVIFTITENYQWAIDHTAISRALIPLVPISILLIAFSFKPHDDSISTL